MGSCDTIEWDMGHERNGTRDTGQGTGKWEGEAPAEPKLIGKS